MPKKPRLSNHPNITPGPNGGWVATIIYGVGDRRFLYLAHFAADELSRAIYAVEMRRLGKSKARISLRMAMRRKEGDGPA